MNIEPGTVLYWEKFANPNIGKEIKNVYMIYLGCDDLANYTIFTYCHRFTTQVHHSNLIIEFKQAEYHEIFSEDCYLNFSERVYEIPLEYVHNHKEQMKLLGKLKNDDLYKILKCVNKSKYYKPKTKIAVRDSFSKINITLK